MTRRPTTMASPLLAEVTVELRRLGAGAAPEFVRRALGFTGSLLGTDTSPRLSPAIPAPHISLSDGDFILEWLRGDHHVAVIIPEGDDLYIHTAGFGDESASRYCETLPVEYLRARLNQMYGAGSV